MADIEVNENSSNIELIDSISISKESNLESPLDNSNILAMKLDNDNDAYTDSVNYDFEFGRDISYGDSQSSLLKNESDSSVLSDLQIEKEVQQTENTSEEPITSKEATIIKPEVKTKVVKKFDQPNSFGSICDVCHKAVYPVERLMYDNLCYHKSCLKCCKCGKTLSPSVVTKSNNSIFCKPHYIECFRKRGRYEDINAPSDDKHVNSSETVTVPAHMADVSSVRNVEHIKQDRVSRDLIKKADDNVNDGDNRVINANESAKAWTDGRVTKATVGKGNNSNQDADEGAEDSVNETVKVKNLTSKFETN